MKRITLLTTLFAMNVAIALAILFVVIQLNPPMKDIKLLAVFMLGSGGLTVLTAYILYRRGLMGWFSSLSWALISTIIITVLLVSINVWVTAQLMFISEHDFILTLALLFFGGVTALFFGLFIANSLIERIGDLSRAAKRLADGDLTARLDVGGSDEISELADTFNWMAESLEKIDKDKRMVEQTRQMLIAGVSHDLRTPLTSIRVMVEAITDGVVTDQETISRYMDNTLTEIQHLAHLIDDLFELAKLDAGQLELQIDTSSMNDLVSDVVSTMTAQANTKQVVLKGDVSPDVDPVRMASDKIQRVLYNLLDNALRYTSPKGEITIHASRKGKDIQVDVHNTDSVIDPQHLPHIFDSFYRVESSRSSQDGHRSTGLGLAIARGFIEAHMGKIWAESQPNQGTTFSFTIPIQ